MTDERIPVEAYDERGRRIDAELLTNPEPRVTPDEREARRLHRRHVAAYQRRGAKIVRKAARQAIRGRTDKAADTLATGLAGLLIEALLSRGRD
jgi:hypothetical protein